MQLSLRWRFAALVALVAYIALVVVTITLLLRNLGFVLMLILTLALLAYALRALLIENTGRRRLAYAAGGIGALALITEIGYFLFARNNARMVIVMLLLAALYAILFTLIRRSYWQAMQSAGIGQRSGAHFKRPYLIINPKSGDGRAMKAHVPELAKTQGVNLLFTSPQTDVAARAEEAARDGADVLGISGGDGSLGAVAAVAMAHDLPVVILPGGTKCHLARDLGFQRERIADSLTAFHGLERRIDVGEINGRIFVNNASFGLYADFVNHPEYREHKTKVAMQTLEDIARGAKKPYDLHFHHDGLNVTKAVEVMVGVNEYNVINLLNLGHRDKLDGGVLQVTAVTRAGASTSYNHTLPEQTSEMDEYKGKLGIYQWTDKTFQLRSHNKDIVVAVDGEREIYNNPVTVRILPAALRVVVPVNLKQGRPSSPFSFAGADKVGNVATGNYG